ncbi:hypothetical protein P73_2687 [Celeribacter indicus]|uniref:SPOR domain-containing protein n=2 Tax=Celeribacter indicus TaxID=1208324 RepID=A0A0B5E4U6_9RHOB|nr:hypothetical protein P73_2687 [Celeribacter indicus]
MGGFHSDTGYGRDPARERMPPAGYAPAPAEGWAPQYDAAFHPPHDVRFAQQFAHGGPAPQYGQAQPVEAMMADDDTAGARPRLGMAQWSGAAVSLALIVGLGIWGYQLLVRDVTGVPVIRALEGSARIVPEDPGGQLAMHQGLAVNSVTADGSAAPPADRLTLAPRPASLTEEDQPMELIAEPVLTSYTPEVPAQADMQDALSAAPDLFPEDTGEGQEEDLETLALTEDPLELQGLEEVSEEEMAEDMPAGPLAVSPIPAPRPVRLASRPAVSDAASLDGVAGDILAAIAGSGEMTASDVPAGDHLVQFGAFQNEEIARGEWERLNARFSDLMAGKTRVIESAESGGKTFYRLRAHGFADASDANRFCAAMTAMNAACVPTVQR